MPLICHRRTWPGKCVCTMRSGKLPAPFPSKSRLRKTEQLILLILPPLSPSASQYMYYGAVYKVVMSQVLGSWHWVSHVMLLLLP